MNSIYKSERCPETCHYCGAAYSAYWKDEEHAIYYCGLTLKKVDDQIQELTPCITEEAQSSSYAEDDRMWHDPKLEGEDEEGNCGTCSGEAGRHLSTCPFSE